MEKLTKLTKGIKADALQYDGKSFDWVHGTPRDTVRLHGKPPNFCRVWKFRNEKLISK